VNNKKKVIFITVFTAIILTGGIVSNKSFADIVTKEERLNQLQVAEKEEKAKLETMPNQTLKEIEKKVEQGHKVKKIGLEAGKLIEELAPPIDSKYLQGEIVALRRVMDTKFYYKTKVDDPTYGTAYAKAVEILEMKKQILSQIEKDLKENKKSIEELTKELEELKKIKELVILHSNSTNG
jgi:peptidoglycan hydrolase CwlO-like protein